MKTITLALITTAFLSPALLRAQQQVVESKTTTESSSVQSGGDIAGDAGAKFEEMKKKMEEDMKEHQKRFEEMKLKLPGLDGKQEPEEKHESHSESKSENATAQASASGGASTSTTSVNGCTTTVTREKCPDGKEKITVTTTKNGGKPKVRELTPEEYEKEFGDKAKARKKGDGKADPKKPEPAAPALPKLPNQESATE